MKRTGTEIPLLSDASEVGVEEKEQPRALAQLSNYHFSQQRIPTRSQALKKYGWMFLGALGGAGYWKVTNKYNEDHHFSDFVAYANVIGVTFSAGLFLLQSVDLAKELLNDLAGSVPPVLEDILQIAPVQHRKKILLKTAIASLIAGVPFLIISINNPLPLTDYMNSELVRESANIAWDVYFYAVNVGLHILPFAVLQSPKFDYYLFPFLLIPCLTSALGRMICKRNAIEAKYDREIKQVNADLTGLHNGLRSSLANRITNSLDQLIQTAASQITLCCSYDAKNIQSILNEQEGVHRLLHLLQLSPPVFIPAVSLYSNKFRIALRIFGAQLQLGAGFTWWTNVFPALFSTFRTLGLGRLLSYSLTALLGAVPSYTLIVILAFFGEMQFPRLIDYLINLVRKLMGYPDTAPLLPPEAKINPILFGVNTLMISFITWFSSVNAKSVNEEQYKDSFSHAEMMVLNIYADIGIRILTFIALFDLYFRYQKEISAVFGKKDSHSQMLAQLLLIKESLPKDIMRMIPVTLIADLKKLKEEELKVLIGPDKDKAWLEQQESEMRLLEARLETKQAEEELRIEEESDPLSNSTLIPSRRLSERRGMSEFDIQEAPPSSSGFFSQCYSFLASGFSCRRRKPVQEPSSADFSLEWSPQ